MGSRLAVCGSLWEKVLLGGLHLAGDSRRGGDGLYGPHRALSGNQVLVIAGLGPDGAHLLLKSPFARSHEASQPGHSSNPLSTLRKKGRDSYESTEQHQQHAGIQTCPTWVPAQPSARCQLPLATEQSNLSKSVTP